MGGMPVSQRRRCCLRRRTQGDPTPRRFCQQCQPTHHISNRENCRTYHWDHANRIRTAATDDHGSRALIWVPRINVNRGCTCYCKRTRNIQTIWKYIMSDAGYVSTIRRVRRARLRSAKVYGRSRPGVPGQGGRSHSRQPLYRPGSLGSLLLGASCLPLREQPR